MATLLAEPAVFIQTHMRSLTHTPFKEPLDAKTCLKLLKNYTDPVSKF